MIHKEEIPDSMLFAGIHPEEKESILKCLSAVEKKYEDPIDKRYLRLEVLDRIETLQEEIEDMKNIIKEDLLSKERSDDDVKRVNEKVKELEQRIVDIIENS